MRDAAAYQEARELMVRAIVEEVVRCGSKAHEHAPVIAERVADRLMGPEPEETPDAP